jgi:hypothetical protein
MGVKPDYIFGYNENTFFSGGSMMTKSKYATKNVKYGAYAEIGTALSTSIRCVTYNTTDKNKDPKAKTYPRSIYTYWEGFNSHNTDEPNNTA